MLKTHLQNQNRLSTEKWQIGNYFIQITDQNW